MSEEAGTETSNEVFQADETPQGQPSDTGTGDSGNPAWNEILSTLPDSLHTVVRPALEKWDKNYQSGIQKVHSQYEPYKPLLDAGFDPQTIQYSLALLDKMENSPREIYDALAEHNGWTGEQGQPEPEVDEEGYEPEIVSDPRLDRAEKLSEAVAEYIMDQQQKQEQAAEDAQLDTEIKSLQEKHGIDPGDKTADKLVMGLMLAGASPEQAFNEYIEMTQHIATRPKANDSAPIIMGTGGVPRDAITSDQLKKPADRKALVANLLRQANQE